MSLIKLGGWSLFASKKIGKKGILIAIDLLPLDFQTVRTIEGNVGSAQFHTIEGDFRNAKEDIIDLLPSNNNINSQKYCPKVDCIIRFVIYQK